MANINLFVIRISIFMSLETELETRVSQIFKEKWTERSGQVVPSPDSIKLTNDAVKISGTILYADMSESTKLVDTYKHSFSAGVYKAYLHCAAKIIRSEGGEITAYDGDRIMAVFIGDYKNSKATRAALKINYARIKIINPSILKSYNTEYQVNHTVGIDTSDLYVANTGIRGAKDLVWVGKAANHAAKLCGLANTHQTRITAEVYNKLPDSLKVTNGKAMWEPMNWKENGRSIYRSSWRWGSP